MIKERMDEKLDLKASWIWYPQRRIKGSTFVFFRKTFDLPSAPSAVRNAWISADSRYQLFVNGTRLQRGPAPFDPRMQDVDPVDLMPYLRPGKNVIAVLVCYFGHGEGTYVPGKAGLLFEAEVECGKTTVPIKTDGTWRTLYGRCWLENDRRWFLRALQEVFDARLYPHGWLDAGYDDICWLPATVLDIPSGRPLLYGSSNYEKEITYHNMFATKEQREKWVLTPRSIPIMRETRVPAARVCDAGWIEWKSPAEVYFDTLAPGAYEEKRDEGLLKSDRVANWQPGKTIPVAPVGKDGKRSIALTFEFKEEYCGHSYIKVRAPAGTVVELVFADCRNPADLMLTTEPFQSQWARCICAEGETLFELFDYEAIRYLQVLVRNFDTPVEILEVGMSRRLYPFAHEPEFECSDTLIARLHQAEINTLRIVAQEHIVDNMTRERQQYPMGLSALYYAFGETRQPSRMIRTFAGGQGFDGWYLDAFPAWDRLERLWQSFLGVSYWGQILDCGNAYAGNVAQHYLFTGDNETLQAIYPGLVKQDDWMRGNLGPDDLLPIDGYKWHVVWVDHLGFKCQEDKQTALNLSYLWYLRETMQRLAEWMGDAGRAQLCRRTYQKVLKALRARYWDEKRNIFTDNLPRLAADGEPRYHELTLAWSLLSGAVSSRNAKPTLDVMETRPANLGPAHPCAWQFWMETMCRFGRVAPVLKELRERFGRMQSFLENNVLGELWEVKPGSYGVMCQNTVGPLLAFYGQILGVRPLAPGFSITEFDPQPGDLKHISATVFTPLGPLRVRVEQQNGKLQADLSLPAGMRLEVIGRNEKRCKTNESIEECTGEEDNQMNIRRWRFLKDTNPRDITMCFEKD